MNVYLSVPMIANRALPRARSLAKAIEDSGHLISSPWVLGPLERQGSGVDVFKRDRDGAMNCDILVADVTEPSIGVGMEIMAAYSAGKRVIIVSRKGNATSGMLRSMDRKETIEYERDDELYQLLKDVL